jgi:para-nitrobenzyl esterase
MSKSLLLSDAIYRDFSIGRSVHGVAISQRLHEGVDGRHMCRRGQWEYMMSKAKKIFRRIAISLLALLIVAAAGIGALWWSLTPSDVAAVGPLGPLGPVSPVERTIDSGTLAGLRDRDIVIFKNIPYAAPPVGALRWRPPQPVTAWAGSRDATKFGNDCWQVRGKSDPARSLQPMSEDCLTVNIWAPDVVPAGGAPVLFWIHGGGFVQGSASQPGLDGSALARRGVVLVSFNYRLGRFGFFAHPALMAEAAGGPTGNWGMMDQVAALRWVKRNIASFGGNPDRITLFGHSAGGASVAQLMLDPEVRGQFAGAIVQSSGGRNRWMPMADAGKDKPSGVRAAKAFAAKQKLDSPDAAALRAIPAADVLGTISFANLDTKTFSGPMIDGKLVKSDFVDGFLAGREAPVPLIVGSTNRELSHLNFLARWGLRQWAKGELGAALDTVRDTYPSSGAFDDNIVNDWGFAEPARTLAASHRRHGFPSWLYSFDYVSEAKRSKMDGAAHASDVTFVFGTLGREGVVPTAADKAASKAIQDYWVAVARDGTPAPAGRPVWPAFDLAADRLLRFTASGPAVDAVQRPRELDAITAAMAARARQR